ncbi:hypothetical protein ACFL1X_00525 [Candidatus Hydrogenedentota bacterium]
MKLINSKSLWQTLDAVNEELFAGNSISSAERNRVADWIASRQGLRGSYPGMFAPTEMDHAAVVSVLLSRTGANYRYFRGNP